MYYLKCGFRITTQHVDSESSPLQSWINNITGGSRENLEIDSEYFPKIERIIHVTKESIRSLRHSLTFNKVPKIFLIHLLFQAIKMINHIPVKGGISDMISPTIIMTGKSINYKKHLSLQIGQYCKVHDEDTLINSNQPHTKGAIYMRQSGNIQGEL